MAGKSRCREALVDDLRDLPPSTKLVFKALEYEGTLTQEGIAEETLLPKRTIRYALSELEEAGIVTSRVSIEDPRKRKYSLVSAVDSDASDRDD